ncbi:hypothetical protein Tco_1404426 [Tanacetum coccineum]
MFESDVNDELWKSLKHVHDITWRLYDTCGVHHVSTKDGMDIYMLVEKEYPLSRGVLTQMLAAKLLVEQNNEMSKELLRKIFMQVRDKVMLKVLPWKGVIRFGKQRKLNPRYVRPFNVFEKVRSIVYKLELPQELSRVHNTLHVSNLKKCYANEPLAVPFDGLHFDDMLQFVEEPVEIMDREVKRLKRSRIQLVKVRWNSQRGPEFIKDTLKYVKTFTS